MVGTTLAHYRITGKLGEGGMGTVYRATDTKLNRDVAIKVLPESFAQDAARMQRFEREAHVLASLNHPNIAAIYGVEQGAIVMELVEGEDLRGPVPVETALSYARQFASGLEAAHEKGIVHRDLKPANIKISADGRVKLLDFGLAKATEETSSITSHSPTLSPTISLAMTQEGTILGTAAYMAPEQARGKAVDKRADIWAFGVVLFELLTGSPVFGGGETVSDTMAAVIMKDPDWAALPADTPPRVRRLLERCLVKDPKQRLRDIGEARILLDEPEPPTAAEPAAARRTAWLPWAVAALALVAAGVAWRRPKLSDTSFGAARFTIPWPEGTGIHSYPAGTQAVPSPDGRNVAFVAGDKASGKDYLWIRPIASVSAYRLDKTEDAALPFWSPDGQFIAFFAEDKLKKIAVSGGSVQTICNVILKPSIRVFQEGGIWNRDGVIVFGVNHQPLHRVPASGGLSVPLTTLEKDESWHGWPQFLRGGSHLLYFVENADTDKSGIYVRELESGKKVLVLRNKTRGVWSPPGYLLFVREGTLFAQRMNAGTFQLEGEPIAVAQEVAANDGNGRSAFAVSENGVLVYRGGGTLQRQLTWFDRSGNVLGLVGRPGEYLYPCLSPDEKSAALGIGSPGRTDTWIMDLGTGILRQITHGQKDSTSAPLWSPDSKRLAVTDFTGGIHEFTVASGNSRTLVKDPWIAQDYSPDGRSLLAVVIGSGRLVLIPLADGSMPQTIQDSSYRALMFSFSPDGKSVAFVSNESGHTDIWVASFPSFAVKRQISIGGGLSPTWNRNGAELFYVRTDGTLMSVAIRGAASLETSVAKPLFKFGARGSHFGVTADGKRFLAAEPEKKEIRDTADLTVVMNWMADWKRE